MSKGLLKWFGGLFAEHTLLQLVATAPTAYGFGVAEQWWRGAGIMFDILPPLFWPILAILVMAVTIYPGFISPVLKHLRGKEQIFWEQVEEAYQRVSHAYRPEILNQAHPGNPHAIEEYAQNAVDILRPLLIKRRGSEDIPPEIEVTDKNSLRDWYNHLRWERARRHNGGRNG